MLERRLINAGTTASNCSENRNLIFVKHGKKVKGDYYQH